MSCDITDPNYQNCTKIIDKLEELEASETLATILTSLVFNFKDARDYVLNYHSDLLEEEEDL